MRWSEVTSNEILPFIDEVCPNAVKLDDMDVFIIGVQLIRGNEAHIVYSTSGIINSLMVVNKFTYEEAITYFNEVIIPKTESIEYKIRPLFKQDLPNPQLN
jgi:hypothetical protein